MQIVETQMGQTGWDVALSLLQLLMQLGRQHHAGWKHSWMTEVKWRRFMFSRENYRALYRIFSFVGLPQRGNICTFNNSYVQRVICPDSIVRHGLFTLEVPSGRRVQLLRKKHSELKYTCSKKTLHCKLVVELQNKRWWFIRIYRDKASS